jgi:hypothetical protein
MSHSYGIYLDGICQFENAHPFLMHLTMAKYVTHKLYNCIVVGVVEKGNIIRTKCFVYLLGICKDHQHETMFLLSCC